MIRLVVNADDLGLHPRIDAGILRAHREGIVTSATVLVTGPSAVSAVKQARVQGLPLGIHLCLTSALPPAAGLSTVAPSGRFRATWSHVAGSWARGQLSFDEVEREWEAQIARAADLGFAPDHLDSHQHLHLLPGIAHRAIRLARLHRLPLRGIHARTQWRWAARPSAAVKAALLHRLAWRIRDARTLPMLGLFEAGRLDEGTLLRCLDALPEGDFELGCHPGLTPGDIPQQPGWRYGWERELAALCSDAARRRIEARGIKLCSYAEIFPASTR